MITYNPKDWFTLIFKFHKSDTFRILFPTMLLLGSITGLVCYLNYEHFFHSQPQMIIFHQISGFIISLVLVFRINTAYDRWWEGRKFWGSLINNSRNLAIQVNTFVPAHDKETRTEFHGLISSFAFSLKEHLRNNINATDIVFSNVLNKDDYSVAVHKPAYISRQLSGFAFQTCKRYNPNPNDYLILTRNINELMEICGGCERIKNTPIPFSYSLFIKKIIFLYVITTPFTFGFTIGYWSVPVVMILFYAFASLELISEEIEDPFGLDPNDLPTDELSLRISEGVQEILKTNDSN
jgi:ion channel-forming bestrophin family protein